jgi:hypothetical protein
MDIIKEGHKLHKAFLHQWANLVLKPLFPELQLLGYSSIEGPIIPKYIKHEPEATVVFKNESGTNMVIISARYNHGYSLVIQSPTLSFRYPNEEEGLVSDPEDILDVIHFHLK